ncbi:extracellular solute-binding protein [Clostridium sp. C2-6-12]|uniref:extracellular solute-binding protein n=1 Tax=Clostridium sp. C2-6-12 TaxID=2698832 RepID=UPI001370B303|nr:extracellular solute-binding protein [Clostridium sp. C2-6-12]
MKNFIKLSCCVMVFFCFIFNFIGCSQVKEKSKKINLWLNTNEAEGKEIEKLAHKWSEENGIDVNVQIDTINAGGSVEQYLNITNNGTDARNPNSPDIEFGLSHEFMEKLEKLNLAEEVPKDIINFDNYISKDIIDAVTINDKICAFPISQECPALFYNKNLVSKVPETMEGLIQDAKANGFKYDINNLYLSYQFIDANGGYIFKNNNGTFDKKNIGLNNEGAIKGYKFLQDLVQTNKLMAQDVNDEMAEVSFYNGEIAYYIGEAKKLEKMKSTVGDLKLGVAPIPKLNGNTTKTFKGIKMALVNPKSEKKEESYKLLKYLIENSKETLITYGNRLPVFKDALEIKSFKNDEYLQGFYMQSKDSEIMPNILETEVIWGPLQTNFNLLLTNQITPKECGDLIVKEINDGIKMFKQ